MRLRDWWDMLRYPDTSPICVCGQHESQHDPETMTREDCDGFQELQ